MRTEHVTQLTFLKLFLQVVRGPVMTLRRMRRRASVCVFTCIHSCRSTTQSPLTSGAASSTTGSSGAGRVTWRMSAWCAVSKMQLWTMLTSRQSVIHAGSLLMRYNETCHTIIIPLGVRGCPTITKSSSDTIATVRCYLRGRADCRSAHGTEMFADKRSSTTTTKLNCCTIYKNMALTTLMCAPCT
jgi:hypothetical protein